MVRIAERAGPAARVGPSFREDFEMHGFRPSRGGTGRRGWLAAAWLAAVAGGAPVVAAEPRVEPAANDKAQAARAEPQGKAQAVAPAMLDWGWALAERRELGLALNRFERAYFVARPLGAERVEINKAFDDLARQFMQGGFAETARLLDRLVRRTDPREDTPATAWSWALRWRCEPQLAVVGRDRRLRLDGRRIYDPGVPAARLKVLLRDPAGTERGVVPWDADPTKSAAELDFALPEQLPLGTWTIEWRSADGLLVRSLPWWTTDEDPAATRARLAETLKTAAPAGVRAWTARSKWLAARVDASSTTPIFLDLTRHRRDLNDEATALAAGTDPYVGKVGTWWTICPADGAEVPVQVIAPPSAADRPGRKPLPLVIAFHGTGGDENMFPFAYGRGLLAKLAVERNFLLVSPLTYPFVERPGRFEPLLEWVKAHYAVDPARVHVLGHSLGGITASRLAATRSERIAGVVCLAGLFVPPETLRLPPTYVYGAELDRIIPAVALRNRVNELAAGNLPIEYRELADLGHTLMVEATLPTAIERLIPAVGE